MTDVLRVLAAAYPGRFTVTADVIELWTETVGCFSIDCVRRAVKDVVQTSEHPPSPATMIDACEAVDRAARPPVDRTPLEDGPVDAVRARGTFQFLRELIDLAAAGTPMAPADAQAEARRRGLCAPDPLWRCRCGEGRGMVQNTDGTWEPCAACNGEAWRNLEAGDYAPRIGAGTR